MFFSKFLVKQILINLKILLLLRKLLSFFIPISDVNEKKNENKFISKGENKNNIELESPLNV